MSGMLAKTWHPAWAMVGYTIITALVFGGLLSSATEMFIFVTVPKCVSGTTDKPYPFNPDPAAAGGYTPSTGPYAPSASVAPFCTQDALFKVVESRFLTMGWFAFISGGASADQNQAYLNIQPYCTKRVNGTCPSCDATGGNSMTVSSGPAVDGKFFITDNRKFQLATGGNGPESVSATSYNNFPITFSVVSGNMPSGVTAGKTYYLRNFNRGGGGGPGGPQPPSFQIAAEQDQAPIATFGSDATNVITATFSPLGSCASQENVQPAGRGSYNPANANPDGTFKESGSCGYCLTDRQRTGVLSVPGLVGVTIALLLLLELMICIPFIRKMGFFRIIVIVISVLCLLFLIAAVGSGANMFREIAQCVGQTDFSSSQLMPSKTAASVISGYQPVTGGIALQEVSGLYQVNQLSGKAAGAEVLYIPYTGAAQLIAAIVFLFLFTIFFAIKTDWAASAPDADSTQMMTPR